MAADPVSEKLSRIQAVLFHGINLRSCCETFGKTSEFSVRTLQQLFLGPRLWPTPATCVHGRLHKCQPVGRDIRTISILWKKQFVQTIIMTQPQPETGVTNVLAKQ